MKRQIWATALAVACGLPAAPAANGAAGAEPQGQRGAEQTERISRTIRIGPGGRLVVSNLAGNIVVTGGGGDEVSIEAVKRTRGSRADLDAVEVVIQDRPGRVTIETEYEGRRGRGRGIQVAVDFTITVPAETDVDMESLSGTLRVTGVRGVVRGETMSGDVVAIKSPRLAQAETVSGTIDLSDAELDGDLEASSMSGDIRARGLKARRIQLSTVSGEIRVSDVSSERLEMQSMSGNLGFAGPLSRSGRYSLSSHSGSVRLEVGDAAGFELNASSFSGSVRSDIPVTPAGGNGRAGTGPRRGRGPAGRGVHGVVGDGSAVLDVRTFSGDINITRR
jgi:hypothetical protein